MIKNKYLFLLGTLILMLIISQIRGVLASSCDLLFRDISHIKFLYLNIILFGPIKEELIFRNMFFKKKNLIVLTIALGLACLGFTFEKLGLIVNITMLLVFIYFLRFDNFKEIQYTKINIFLIVFSSFLFWVFHFWNYDEINTCVVISTSPIFIIGIMLCYIRVKYGLFYAALIHALHNALVVFHAF